MVVGRKGEKFRTFLSAQLGILLVVKQCDYTTEKDETTFASAFREAKDTEWVRYDGFR